MVEDWIDALTKVWEISDGKGGTVKSYRVFERDEFPEDVPLDRPCALTFVDNVDYDYGSGMCVAIWHGSSIFHLSPNLQRSHIPNISRYFNRILVAAAANMTLGDKVSYFVLESVGSVSLSVLQYGNEAKHLGLTVNWLVKENPGGLVVSNG